MEELARVLLLLVFLAVALAFARDGWAGVRDWFHVKLIGA